MGPIAEFSDLHILLAAVALTFGVWLLVYRFRRAKDLMFIYDKLAGFNKTYGTSFPTNIRSKSIQTLGILGYSDTSCLMFDVDRRKVAISRRGACQLESFEYLQEWQLSWIEKRLGKHMLAFDVQLMIYTIDVRQPVVIVRVPTLQYGKALESKLAMLMFSQSEQQK